MPDFTAVLVPLLNPNEPEALLASLQVQEGQPVTSGQVLCVLETTKSTAEVMAEQDGYVRGLQAQPGELLQAGKILCYLAASPDWSPPEVVETSRSQDGPPEVESGSQVSTSGLPVGLRITRPALAQALQAGYDLYQLPIGPLITSAEVRKALAATTQPAGVESSSPESDPTALLIFGGGGHGKMLIELIGALKTYHIVGIVDDGLEAGQTVMGLPVLGGSAVLAEWYARGIRLAVNAVGGIGNVAVRIQVFDKLHRAGYTCPALGHPNAWIEPSARLAPGVQVFAQAYVGSQAEVAFGAIVSTGAIVSHDCQVGEYANLSPGATLAGEVIVGNRALIGMRATVNLRVKIGAGARVGNGATVKSDVPENGIVRAGTIWPQ